MLGPLSDGLFGVFGVAFVADLVLLVVLVALLRGSLGLLELRGPLRSLLPAAVDLILVFSDIFLLFLLAVLLLLLGDYFGFEYLLSFCQ